MRFSFQIVTAVAGATLAFALAASAGHAAPAGNIEIAVVERALSDKTVDIGAKGDSIGDLLVFANPLYDAANSRQIGTDNGSCTRTVVGKAWECSWTNVLADGQLMVTGTFHDKGESVFAVIGGTGRYAGMRGQMNLRFRDPKGMEYNFKFSLTN